MVFSINMKRRVIQIAVAPAFEDSPEYVYALCDDGTMWWLPGPVAEAWRGIPDVPQPFATASGAKAQSRQAQLKAAHA